jgi:phage terminase large subunit GpA-like protein
VDAGFEMAQVLEFCRPRLNRKVYAIKGASGFGKPIWPRRASKGVHRGEFFVIGSDTAKERVYSKLRVNLPGAGYCHFPLNRERDWFDMLTAERIKTRTVHGRAERYFQKPDGVRNEALDCRAYATAALHALYMSGFKLADQAARMKAMVAGNPEPVPAYPVYRSRFVGR